MDLKIKGKVAVAAASSKGLGRAVAEALAAEGVNLAICSRDEAAINKAAEEIKKSYNVEVLAAVCDVTDRDAITAFRTKVIDRFKTCHILYANAGGPPLGRVEEFRDEDFRRALELNLLSTINLVNLFLPYMKEQQWGRILASTSVSVRQPILTLALSNVARVGVVAFIKSLAQDVAPFNVTANCLAPGYIMTERLEELFENQAKTQGISFDQAMANAKDAVPAKRIGKPEDFGALCAFLASEWASYITGETILMDGAMYKGLM